MAHGSDWATARKIGNRQGNFASAPRKSLLNAIHYPVKNNLRHVVYDNGDLQIFAMEMKNPAKRGLIERKYPSDWIVAVKEDL